MKLSEAAIIVEASVTHALSLAGTEASRNNYLVPYLEGPPGGGKTALVEALCKKLGIGCVILSLAQYDPAEIAGWVVAEADGENMKRARPDWMPAEGTKGIIFIDELPQGPTPCQNVAAQIVNERRCGKHRIPDGWAIVCAGNAATDRAGTNHVPTHLRNRLMYIAVESDVDDVVRHFFSIGVDPRVCAYLRFRPDRLHQFDRDAFSCPSPRSWERVGAVLSLNLPAKARSKAIQGNVGASAGADFEGYLKLYEAVPDMDDLIKNPDKAVIPTDPGVLYAVTASLTARMNKDTAPNIVRYLNRMPRKEFAAFCMIDAINKDTGLASVKEVQEWALNTGTSLFSSAE